MKGRVNSVVIVEYPPFFEVPPEPNHIHGPAESPPRFSSKARADASFLVGLCPSGQRSPKFSVHVAVIGTMSISYVPDRREVINTHPSALPDRLTLSSVLGCGVVARNPGNSRPAPSLSSLIHVWLKFGPAIFIIWVAYFSRAGALLPYFALATTQR
jgi:hypothetical protein